MLCQTAHARLNAFGAAVLLLVAALAVSCGSLVYDTAVSAIEGRDFTLVLSGYNQTARDGYLFVRTYEGNRTSGFIRVIFPRALQCGQENCAAGRVIGFGGRNISFGVPEGLDHFDIPVSQIVGSDLFERSQDGEYLIRISILYPGPTGENETIRVEGLVRFRIMTRDYARMGCNSSAVAWERRISSSCSVQYSTAGRVAICGDCT